MLPGIIAVAFGLSTFFSGLKLYELQHETDTFVRALWIVPSVLLLVGSALFGLYA